MAKKKQGSREPDAAHSESSPASELDADGHKLHFDAVDIVDDNPDGELSAEQMAEAVLDAAKHTPPSKSPIGPDEKSYLRQNQRPTCPRCGHLMHAVSTQIRADGPSTYYGCKVEECGEKGLIPIPKQEFIDQLHGNIKGSRRIEQIDVSQGETEGPVDGTQQIKRGVLKK